MTCAALTAVSLFVVVAALAFEINAEDELAEPSPDPFRLHRFRAGDRQMEEE